MDSRKCQTSTVTPPESGDSLLWVNCQQPENIRTDADNLQTVLLRSSAYHELAVVTGRRVPHADPDAGVRRLHVRLKHLPFHRMECRTCSVSKTDIEKYPLWS